jgi:putative membrane protein
MPMKPQLSLRTYGLTLAVLAALTLSIAPTVWAQGSTTPAAPATTKAEDASKLDRGDRQMLQDLAQGNMAEVDAGKMALEKSQNAEVKKFAQQMVDDHGKALGDVQALATGQERHAAGRRRRHGQDQGHRAESAVGQSVRQGIRQARGRGRP